MSAPPDDDPDEEPGDDPDGGPGPAPDEPSGDVRSEDERDGRGPARVVELLLGLSIVAALGLGLVYLRGGQPQLEGALLGVSLGALGAALVVLATRLLPDEESTEERHPLPSQQQARDRFWTTLQESSSPLADRRGLLALMAGAVGALALAALAPLRSLGPRPGRDLYVTPWRDGSRLVTRGGGPLRPDTLEVGGILTVFPEGHEDADDAATVVIRVRDDEMRLPEDRRDWVADGNVAYSKICTHVGCPVGLYRESSHELLCPCHQSTFDVLDGAQVRFGPAPRPLPQLPLGIDEEGFLVARGDFPEPVGPIFWDRDR
ncbi:ubiquinol-cytochrome c reductase iron-sulfur subunit [Dermatobacter hominis]|uniref:ubiquinol-cytochrome c reductase iron-sulfur subunit n=1 Tax=Dermatobacter hominis TaxID=2884263 RepID=UPI001D12A12A|nr:Rieske 2Fe-2S domain-containing protein [Dermatobacter hominis]UDY34160.1 Rieske (2Fe-2S) protein [Dermatobacter hominis]